MRLSGLTWLLLSMLLTYNAALSAQEASCQFSVRVESEQQSTAAGSHNATWLSQQSYALLEHLAQQVNCTVKPASLPAGRAIKMLEQGQVDVMVGMSQTAERLQYSHFVGPHHTERMVVVGLRSIAHKVHSLEQLLRLKGAISVTEGAYYGPTWHQILEADPALGDRLFYASGNQQKLAMLASGRVIASLEDETIIDQLLQRDALAETYTKLFVIHENPVYFAFSRHTVDQQLYQKLQRQWQIMQQNGEAEQIRQQLSLSSL